MYWPTLSGIVRSSLQSVCSLEAVDGEGAVSCVFSIRTRGINFPGISAPGAASFKEWVYDSNMASMAQKTARSLLQI